MVFPPVLRPAIGKNIELPAAFQTGACDAQLSAASGLFFVAPAKKNQRACLPLSLKFNLAGTHFSSMSSVRAYFGSTGNARRMVFPAVLCLPLGKNIGRRAASQTGARDCQLSAASGFFSPPSAKEAARGTRTALKFILAATHFSKFVFSHAFLCLRISRINCKRELSLGLERSGVLGAVEVPHTQFSTINAHIYIFGHNCTPCDPLSY